MYETSSISDNVLKYSHLSAAIFHAAQAGYSFYFTNGKYKDKGYYTITNDVNVNGKATSEDLVTYRLGNLIGSFPTLSTFNHLWAFFDFDTYLDYVDNQGYNPVRWTEYSLSAGLMFVIIGQMSGITDVKLLTSMLIGNGAMQYLGYSIEKEVGQTQHNHTMYRQFGYESAMRQEYAGFAIFVALWSSIFVSFYTALSRYEKTSDEGVPDMVYAIVFILFVLMLMFGLLSIAYVRGLDKDGKTFRIRDFRKVELGYIILSFISKSLLTNMTLFGVIFRDDD